MVSGFAVALLVGGRSQRMGCDKAMLPWGGVPLWERQLRTLEALEPVEVFVCAGARADLAVEASRGRVLADLPGGRGPMAGIAAVLAETRCERVVVLAVDLPGMTSEFLAALVAEAAAGGIVLERDGFFEGLAAIYPRGLAASAAEVARGEDCSVQRLVRDGVAAGMVRTRVVRGEEDCFFLNVNRVGDLSAMD